MKHTMLKSLFVLLLLAGISTLQAQSKLPPVDKSTMDMSYYPVSYPILKIQNKASEPLAIRCVYSRPLKNGRPVFGELVEYGKVWRIGANECTELEFFRDVRIGSQKVKKGRYSLFAIPYPDKWTLILNRDTDSWGAFAYDEKKDVLRLDVRTEKAPETAEAFTIYFEKNNGSVSMITTWDDVRTVLPIYLQ